MAKAIEYDKDYYSSQSIKTDFLTKRYVELLRESAIPLKNQSICDIGCASGNFLNELLLENDCFGLDISEHAISLCRQKFPDQKDNFIVHDIDKEPLELHRKFDLIVLFDVIEHLKNFSYLQYFFQSHLKENGFIIITTPNASSLQRYLLGNSRFNGERDPTHIFTFTPYTFDFFTRRIGLQKKEVFYPFGFYMKNNFLTRKIKLGAIIFGIYQMQQHI